MGQSEEKKENSPWRKILQKKKKLYIKHNKTWENNMKNEDIDEVSNEQDWATPQRVDGEGIKWKEE